MRVLCEAQGARCISLAACQGRPRFAAISGLNTTVTLIQQVVFQRYLKRIPADFNVLTAVLCVQFIGYSIAVSARHLTSAADIDGGEHYMQYQDGRQRGDDAEDHCCAINTQRGRLSESPLHSMPS